MRFWVGGLTLLLAVCMLTTAGGEVGTDRASDVIRFGIRARRLELGIGTHLGFGRTDPSRLLKWIERSGMTSIRDEMPWNDVETSRGEYRVKGSIQRTRETLQSLGALGVSPLIIAGYGNDHYDRGGQPLSAEGRRAFAGYAGWLARTTSGAGVRYLEIWNEWNLGANSRPRKSKGDPKQYVELLAAAYQAIKAESPTTAVVAGAMGGDADGWPWLREALAAGMARYADGVSFHLYNHAGPRAGGGVPEIVSRIQSAHELIRAAGKDLPLYVTEVGTPNRPRAIGRACLGIPGCVASEAAADDALRTMLEVENLPYVAGLWFYEFSDGGESLDPEHSFGGLNQDYSEKPLGCGLREGSLMLKGEHAIDSFLSADVGVSLFRPKAGEQLLAVWQRGGKPQDALEVRLRGTDLRLRPRTLCGVTPKLGSRNRLQVSLKISRKPIFFSAPRSAVIVGVDVEPLTRDRAP